MPTILATMGIELHGAGRRHRRGVWATERSAGCGRQRRVAPRASSRETRPFVVAGSTTSFGRSIAAGRPMTAR
jgi:hypothetical protein